MKLWKDAVSELGVVEGAVLFPEKSYGGEAGLYRTLKSGDVSNIYGQHRSKMVGACRTRERKRMMPPH